MLMTPGPAAMFTPAWMGGPGADPTAEPAPSVPAVAPAAFLKAPWNLPPHGAGRPMEPANPPPKRRKAEELVEAEEQEGLWAKVFVDGVVHEAIMGSPMLNMQAREALKAAPKHRACECASLRRVSATNRV